LPLYHDKITFNDSNIENVQENTSWRSSYIDKTAKENPTYDLFQRIGVKNKKTLVLAGKGVKLNFRSTIDVIWDYKSSAKRFIKYRQSRVV